MSIPVTNVEFLEAMFPDMPEDAAAIVAGFAGDPGSPPQFAWAARPWLYGERVPWQLSAGTNNYVAVGSFRRDPSGRYRRRHDLFARLHAVMVDDIGTKIAAARIRLPLSAELETSPGNFQGWYFLESSEATDDVSRARRLIDALVESGLTAEAKDPGMAGANRYGRLPVGVNGKAKYVAALGHPFRCRVTAWRPETRYTVEQLAAAYRLDMAPRVPPARKELRPGEATRRVDGFAELLASIESIGIYLRPLGDGRHAIVCPWYSSHSDRALTGTAVMEPAPANSWAGGFKCHHTSGGCDRRTIADLYRWARALRREARTA